MGRLPNNHGKQIPPFRVFLLDQSDLPVPPPFLDRLLAGYGSGRIVIRLEPNQAVDAVSFGETWYGLGFVLVNPAREIVRNSEIERPVSTTGEEIDTKWHRAHPDQVSRRSCLLAEAEVIPGRPARAGPGTYEHGLSRMISKVNANVIEL
jgi:hypothetical protein